MAGRVRLACVWRPPSACIHEERLTVEGQTLTLWTAIEAESNGAHAKESVARSRSATRRTFTVMRPQALRCTTPAVERAPTGMRPACLHHLRAPRHAAEGWSSTTS